ncbi:hypothetical protein B1A99_18590 [Cohnella sp. CIP 111063]|uniref:hypothetical protein n=1 Tax=unclassified Cohnella TaxID=2636738 RepID=UPI000B8C4466|nr:MULTISPECIES: hypothetical protein [unclassified Cohnella]OXS56871.1 hypothetical protein B1A99_18590 [Cohnella sp. CIP 111063]PRX69709.1 hypothetical protein B0G52_11267 [Cohnella sp. SGD-V74]
MITNNTIPPQGNATPADVVEGKTFQSAGSFGKKTGTMQNFSNSSERVDLDRVLGEPGAIEFNPRIWDPFVSNGSTTFRAEDSNFIQQNIRSGVTVFGLPGHYTGGGGGTAKKKVVNVTLQREAYSENYYRYNFFYQNPNMTTFLDAYLKIQWPLIQAFAPAGLEVETVLCESIIQILASSSLDQIEPEQTNLTIQGPGGAMDTFTVYTETQYTPQHGTFATRIDMYKTDTILGAFFNEIMEEELNAKLYVYGVFNE